MHKSGRLLLLLSVLPMLCGVAHAQTTAAPSYIKADRTASLWAFGSAATNVIFSAQLSAGRKWLVAKSLKENPVSNCVGSPAFTLTRVAPLRVHSNVRAWVEKYDIACRPPVRRSVLFIAWHKGKGGLQARELMPGDTIAGPQLQHDLLPQLMAAAGHRVHPPCSNAKEIQVTDTQLLAAPKTSPGPWRERWMLVACGHRSSIDIDFAPDPIQGGTIWKFLANPPS